MTIAAADAETPDVPTDHDLLMDALRPDVDTEDYTATLRAGAVQLQRCVACGSHQAPPLPFCRRCGGDELGRTRARGTGRIITVTRVHYRFHSLSPEPPYTVAVVELDEGPRLLGLLGDDCDVTTGTRVLLKGPFDLFGPTFTMAPP